MAPPRQRDAGLDGLLDLNGQVLVVDPEGGYWVKFVVHKVPVTAQKPHGLSYSLTLHGGSGERLIGYDNAHPIPPRSGPAGRRPRQFDHSHRIKTVKPYEYTDAATLLTDFWTDVEDALRQKGVVL